MSEREQYAGYERSNDNRKHQQRKPSRCVTSESQSVKTGFEPGTVWGVDGILMIAFAAFHGSFFLVLRIARVYNVRA